MYCIPVQSERTNTFLEVNCPRHDAVQKGPSSAKFKMVELYHLAFKRLHSMHNANLTITFCRLYYLSLSFMRLQNNVQIPL
jgi:hypothetical protein